MRPTRIAVDWDSTLAEEVWPGMGDWLPGAVEALKALAGMYDEVVIFTLRVCPVDLDEVTPRDPMDQIRAINTMLWQAGIPGNVRIWMRPYKPPTQFFIDDRNIHFGGSWEETLNQLNTRRVLANHKEETVEEAPIWIDQDAPVCGCNGRCSGPEEKPYHPDDDAWQYTEESVMRQFETGATRNVDVDQLDYEGFLSPLSLWAFASYMHKNRFQADGNVRDSDNWQKGIPVDSYRKSLIRHVMDVWLNERGYTHLSREDTVTALCAILFNAGGLLHELLKADIEIPSR